ncbi:MAG: hypothetical protein RPU59_06990, partial [Candidatus Sedimenticola sp. (ex Thyasira tokunagai)]
MDFSGSDYADIPPDTENTEKRACLFLKLINWGKEAQEGLAQALTTPANLYTHRGCRELPVHRLVIFKFRNRINYFIRPRLTLIQLQ